MIEVYTDGAAKGNPGLSGVGIFIKDNETVYQYSFHLGTYSSHEAEFMAVIKALEICQTLFPNEILSFRTDSRVVVDVIEKDFTKNKNFLPYLEKIRNEASRFPYFFIKWIPKTKNKQADKLAKEAIHTTKT
ncbi:ribonuclease HI family protein [Salirhabdus salicampi]|uniref:ribonuclease HI family protein n=1 Tax=Salirhabdus salicampi TaxID=476102 RepID=UPI0020C22700|nr:ribonuclease HI family protein [Salirhabdus salicampi]MCP8616241.1 ribonuclease HI family protein [Salirhabdus salicampi]